MTVRRRRDGFSSVALSLASGRETRNAKRETRGFTLIEILIAISLLAVIVTIVYESFAAVTDATEAARLSAEELRLRQFLGRSFTNNFSTVYVDPGFANEQFQFIGVSETGSSGAMGSVEFCSSAPLMGGTAPPGFFKRVRYGAASPTESGTSLEAFDSSSMDGLAESTLTFEATESLLAMSAPTEDMTGGNGNKNAAEQAAAFGGGVTEAMSPAWTAPIDGLDLSYFDGEEWVDEWDSMALGRLPWCVRIRVNFARLKSEEDTGFRQTLEEDPDFEMFIPIPLGTGVLTDAATWLQDLDAQGLGGIAAGLGGGTDGSASSSGSQGTGSRGGESSGKVSASARGVRR